MEWFREPAAYGGHESVRFRIDLKVEATLIALRSAKRDDFAFCRRVKHDTMHWIVEQLFGWDEKRQVERFASQWRLHETRTFKYSGHHGRWLRTPPVREPVF